MKYLVFYIIFSCLCISAAFSQTNISVIPEPAKIELSEGVFFIEPGTKIFIDKQTRSLGDNLAGSLSIAMGFELAVENGQTESACYIKLKKNAGLSSLGKEGYRLTVRPENVLLEAYGDAGIFYGIQTLRQLLPPEIFSRQSVKGVQWQIPCVKIEDVPRFSWRGMHLDVGRYFLPKEFVKKYIDLMAMHKMNVFHWHLTEDQGWRIEIKKYPKLTKIGAWRKETLIGHMRDKPRKFDGKKHGGFYTQDEIREIVDYARQRYITIVPEIEMPGHCLAALAAYPELSCSGGPFEVKTIWGIENDVYCAGNDKTIEFLQDVLTEVIELFPGEYIHIGGDECRKNRWEKCSKCQARIKAEGLKDEHELQSWFVRQMDKFLTAHGCRLIGWEEILQGGLAKTVTVMSWRGKAAEIAAAKSGHDVVMAENKYTYLNFYQADRKTEPLAIGNFLPIEKMYSYDPVPAELSEVEKKHIIGVQAQLWTEYISTPKMAEYMAYPRACAMAEVAWSPVAKKDFEVFEHRLKIHLKRLGKLGVNFRPLD